jgi:type IV pilus assembly protein PilY1
VRLVLLYTKNAVRRGGSIGFFLCAWSCLIPAAWADIPQVKIAPAQLMHNGAGTAGAGISAKNSVPGGAFIYQAGFGSNRWNGSLKKISVKTSANGTVEAETLPDWDAAEILNGISTEPPRISPHDRKIYTSRPSGEKPSGTVPFQWEYLGENQKAFLNSSPITGAIDGLGRRRLNYLRGLRSDELNQPGGIFRNRAGILGAIVHSLPVVVGAPTLQMAGSDYRKFYAAVKDRAPVVYVSASDGMLHAFDAKDGFEHFAYVPNALMPQLGQLSRPDYLHKSYVDGEISVAEAKVRGQWKTILAAGMGAGAQGVFALDVTDPANFIRGSAALWEFTDKDDAEIGYVMTAPVIVRLKTRLVQGVPEYRHFVAVGSGLNNYVDDGNFNPAAPAVLFLLSLDKGPAEQWRLGANYFKFKKPISDINLPQGLGSPAFIINEDGAAKYAYAGDMQGNLWRFDFTGPLPWTKENATHMPLFTALDNKLSRQPITSQPRVAFAPGGYVVLFGTGKFLEEADVMPGNFSVQSVYGIYDTAHKSYAVAGRNQLEPRSLVRTGNDAMHFTGKNFAYGHAPASRRGWYFDFWESDQTGERNVSSPIITMGKLVFNSLIPCAKPCPRVSGRRYVLDALSGMPLGEHTSGALANLGLLPFPLLLDLGATIGKKDAFGKAIVNRQITVIHASLGGSKDILNSAPGKRDTDFINTYMSAKRLSWREILNWQDFPHANRKK